jgi:hypothetical protein
MSGQASSPEVSEYLVEGTRLTPIDLLLRLFDGRVKARAILFVQLVGIVVDYEQAKLGIIRQVDGVLDHHTSPAYLRPKRPEHR